MENSDLKELKMNEIQKSRTGFTSIDKPYLDTLPKFNYDPDFSKKSIYDMILESPGNKPDMPALEFYGTNISNKELYRNIDAAAKAFKNSGIKKDDIVFMFCLNTPEMVASLYALNRIGAITEWFNPQGITSGMIHELIKENHVKTIITIDILYGIIKEAIKDTDVEQVIVNSVQDSFNFITKMKYKGQVFGVNKLINSSWYIEQLNKIKDYLPSSRTDINLNVQELSKINNLLLKIDSYSTKEKIKAKASFYKDYDIDSRFISWPDFMEKYYTENCLIYNPYDFEKTSLIVHTGGTTGPVKRVAMTDYAMNSAIYQSTLLPLKLKIGAKLCQIVPPIVAWGLESHHVARYYNMNTSLIATYDRNELLNIMKKKKANVYFTVPSFVKTIKENEETKRVKIKDFSYVDFIGYGGESMSPEDDKAVDEILKKYGSSCRNQFGYGQNEEFGCFAVNFDIEGMDKTDFGCCGWPMPGNDYIIVDNDTLEELPYGLDDNNKPYIGELWVTGPTIMKGYIGISEKENENTIVYRDGKKYIRTGDQAYIDNNGKLWYCTRNQRIIRTQQGKVFTYLLEDIINDYEEVLECCVVAAPNPETVKEVSCHIVLKPNYLKYEDKELNELINNIISRLENNLRNYYEYYIPGTYEFRSERIPITSSMGKMDFKKLEEQNEQEFKRNGGKSLKKVRLNFDK